ncbi:ABC transporter ATP-binding protein [Vulgatibacter incomptus]|uniref:Lipoprotein releasing system ATP-binding protein LolD n=1 Tax=Vulgatibacter incomptus TaxID=1391653 RepID=A0A0K1PAQ8_9BACT|nr:ABC transporter ATP-binding protein [Vulgatibacter incomptus]AKU90605.1 Lipoprotein releasing system ATP-binding protein LolD [Vulgatibacter incomptus]
MTETRPLIEAHGITKDYWHESKGLVQVLRGVDFAMQAGEVVALVGKSGAGKSTLLHVLGTLDEPTTGTVCFEGEELVGADELRLADFRSSTVGFVFQSHYLLPEFSALENAMMPLLVRRVHRDEATEVARKILERVGLGHRLDHKPSELSGGEQQRVALARALAPRPRLLLADEPTGNLDAKTAAAIHELLVELNRELGISCLVVTHNEALARELPRCVEMRDGLVV